MGSADSRFIFYRRDRGSLGRLERPMIAIFRVRAGLARYYEIGMQRRRAGSDPSSNVLQILLAHLLVAPSAFHP